ncbi:ArsR/SmtB family transcription factor [Vibrio sp. McD22-P3]|uniref:ArsR/SmtB family transcription factor n=1 Tax=Vibrio sp. McD22-P3 TaxID=2724880 RepID=UPI001F459BB4|nr:metalloregulator ArsR/SmtB family transcription factor [Vibrio sp. McD22-P3]MCF4176887.1 metalloregulator ArsR/SmtB family transcription factor [Vibrio sp. McD22-P3]
MKLEKAANILKELGHPVRLKIYKVIVKSGKNSITVGDIQAHLDIPSSTLSHHLAHLVSAELIQQVRDGRSIYCEAKFDNLDGVISFLIDECCLDKAA